MVAQKVRISKYTGDSTFWDRVESNCDVLSKDSWKCKWQFQNGEDLILQEYSFKNGKYFESFHGRVVGLAPRSTFGCAK